ncbi:ribonuclease T2 [Auriscalpium vulgare]|uniref:Ribonuclease T2 n=1 Tax=Auriscalpium vulgare TaxID=40419 RepID=A0ACB8RRH5_9AGAM|nr:ribonuclease T2 [Auriscalpium vulgare]
MLTAASLVSLVFAGAVLGSALPQLFSPVDTPNLFKRVDSGCGTSGQTSCSNTTVQKDLCCFQAPGGLLLQTQFWDTNPSTGPSNSWTIHGTTVTSCDGTFQESCDSSRAYTGIASLLTAQGASDTLSFMQQYWVDINGDNEKFWEHEWSTHGTCMSTLEPSCLPSGSAKGAEAIAFFQQVVALFKTLPTYEWLSDAGITPSSSKTFTLSQLTTPLKAAFGGTPAIDCTSGAVNQISYYYHLKGSVLDGEFIPIDAPSKGSCASSGLKYPLKTGSPASTSGGRTGTTSTGTGTTSTGTAPGSIPTKATIQAITSSGSVGGLLSAGTWSTQTPGTYTISGSSSSFTLTSSKGKCAVSSSTFSCGSSVSTASTFSAVSSGGNILVAFGGSTAFSSSGTPSGSTAETVFTGSSQGTSFTLALVSA